MFQIPFWAGLLAFSAVWLTVRIILWITRRRIDWKQEAKLLLMYVNLAVIFRFTFFPFELVDGRVQPLIFDAADCFPPNVNLIPFTNLFVFDTKRELLVNLIGNVAMFIPSGVILPIICSRPDRFWKVLAAGAGISLCIELLQLPFAARVSDVNDLILNTVGVIIGYGLYALVRAMICKTKSSSVTGKNT